MFDHVDVVKYLIEQVSWPDKLDYWKEKEMSHQVHAFYFLYNTLAVNSFI